MKREPHDHELESRLSSLRTRYAAQLEEKVGQITAGWRGFADGPWSDADLGRLRRMVHNLAGSGSTFGFAAVSLAATQLEGELRTLAGPPSAEERGRVVALLHDLQSCIATLAVTGAGPGQAGEASALVYVAAADGGRELVGQLANFGYLAEGVGSIAELAERARARAPDAAVIDLQLASPADCMAALRPEAGRATPAIFVAQRGDFAARLEVVRAGGSAYFTHPVDIGAVVDQLDLLTERQRPEPFRVLVVDDSPTSARFHAAILRAAGMAVAVANDPAAAPTLMADLQPDLVLMDMYMPGCDGRELAAVIRQQPSFHSTPIVFLSSETDRVAQLRALEQGGDDFLTKPISPDHLALAVQSRAQRARVMRSQMVRDGLTGLFNHSVTKEHLGREVARARRSQRPLALALLDLDRFKLVNDTYGHAAGDRVLKSLARLLLQRLRASDVVGRFGGEEFAVIFPDTDGSAALAVVEGIRERFAQIRHRAGDVEFGVSFSAGVAAMPPYGEAANLSERADVALYQAKRHGRNRTVLAPPELQPAPGPAINPYLTAAEQPGAGAVNVLVVDDDPDLRELLQTWLSAAGMRVRLAPGGAEAMTMMLDDPPDLVLLDMLMPEVSGLDVLDRLREHELGPAVVMTTAFGSEQIAVSAIRRGADDYLRKPIDPTELQTVLERTLARLQLRRQNIALRRQLDELRRRFGE